MEESRFHNKCNFEQENERMDSIALFIYFPESNTVGRPSFPFGAKGLFSEAEKRVLGNV